MNELVENTRQIKYTTGLNVTILMWERKNDEPNC